MSRVGALHRKAIERIMDEADQLEGTARRIKQMAAEVLEGRRMK